MLRDKLKRKTDVSPENKAKAVFPRTFTDIEIGRIDDRKRRGVRGNRFRYRPARTRPPLAIVLIPVFAAFSRFPQLNPFFRKIPFSIWYFKYFKFPSCLSNDTADPQHRVAEEAWNSSTMTNDDLLPLFFNIFPSLDFSVEIAVGLAR